MVEKKAQSSNQTTCNKIFRFLLFKADQKQWDKDSFDPSMNLHQRREALGRDMHKILHDKAQIKQTQLDKEQALYYYQCELARPGADRQKSH